MFACQPPYVTKCKNYATDGYIDRGNCFEKCFIEESLKMHEIHTGPRIAQDQHNDKMLIGSATIFSNASMSHDYYVAEQKCDQLCKPENARITSTYRVGGTRPE